MFKLKRCKSVIHSTAHHAVSALSWLHPELGEICTKASVRNFQYNLLNSTTYPSELELSKGKYLALSTLSDTFLKIAKSESIERDDLKSAVITFGFKSDTWPYFCEISVESICGKTLSVRVDSMGALL